MRVWRNTIILFRRIFLILPERKKNPPSTTAATRRCTQVFGTKNSAMAPYLEEL